MEHYKHILLTTDFSPHGLLVADRAREIADSINAKLSIVHVVEFSPIIYGGGEFAVPLDVTIEETIEQQARDGMNQQADRLNIVAPDRHLLTGSTKEEVVKLVKEIGADLLVVGGHDLHGLRLLFGSTANSILHAMPCDVLTVRLEEDPA